MFFWGFVSSRVIVRINLISDYDWLKDCQGFPSIQFDFCLFWPIFLSITFRIYYTNPIYSNSLKCIAFTYDSYIYIHIYSYIRSTLMRSIWHLHLANFLFNRFPNSKKGYFYTLMAILTFSLVCTNLIYFIFFCVMQYICHIGQNNSRRSGRIKHIFI